MVKTTFFLRSCRHPDESRGPVDGLDPGFRRDDVDSTILVFRCAAIALGLLFAWTSRQSSNPDGICYLDLADAFRYGHWNSAINPIWCPLYPALLGIASYLLRPSPYWEFPMTHLVNFGVYLCTLMGFEFLLNELRARRQRLVPVWAKNSCTALPEEAWVALCYMAFLYGTLSLIQLITVTPDLCVAAAVFVATGLTVRIQNGDHRMRTFALLGLVLGVGYFAKTVMFFMGFVFLGVAAVGSLPWRRALPGALCSLMVFLLTMSLFIVPLYRIKHRFTFGDIGRIRYAWSILNLSDFPLHSEGIPGHGIPAHPYNILVNDPRIYEFSRHIAGTYSPAFDMSYWFEGLKFHVEPWRQIPVLLKSLKVYADIFQVEFTLLLGLVVLYGIRGRNARWFGGIMSEYALIIPALAALAIFGLMDAEGRYVGAYVTLLLVGIISGVRLPKVAGPDPMVWGLVLVMLIGPTINLLHGAGSSVKFEWRLRQGLETPPCLLHWQVAEALKSAGLQEGAPVASLGISYGAYWARLARAHIVAEAPDPGQFWNAESSAQSHALGALDAIGVRAVVGQRKAPWRPLAGWRQVGHTDYFVRLSPLKNQ